MQVQHFSHEHPLEFRNNKQEEREESVNCHCCQNRILEKSMYACSKCKIFLHKECANLSQETKVSVHSEHPLSLLANPIYPCFCAICGQGCEGFTYNCISCKFDLCIKCTFLVLQDRAFRHESHPHLLTLVQRLAHFDCDACDQSAQSERELSYICTTCPFWIHESCASLPTTMISDGHQHSLSLAYSLPFNFRHYGFKCDVCHWKINPSRWVYYCYRCRYFTHVKCRNFTRSIPAGKLRGETLQLPDPNLLISLPWRDVSVDIIKPFIEKNSDRKMQSSTLTEINHFSHEDPLILSNEAVIKHFTQKNSDRKMCLLSEINHFSHQHPLILSNEAVGTEQQCEEILCEACIEPVLSPPYYSCTRCSFMLHLACSCLPTKLLKHPSHPEHQLLLRKLILDDSGFFYCKSCYTRSNGFFFECKGCDFQLDLYCAILPPTISHEAHNEHHEAHNEHRLARRVLKGENCEACGGEIRGPAYRCYDCHSYCLHLGCTLLPRGIRHRWEKHLLTLMYPPFSDHPSEFYCEICEEEIHPKRWQYHCRECDQSFHPSCIPRLGKDRFIKFGSTLQIKHHQHILRSVRESGYKSYCTSCATNLDGQKAFQCGPCRFFLCFACACRLPPQPSTSDYFT